MNDYLKKRAQQLNLGRADQLAEIQIQLDRWYPGQCRAASLNDGVLKITTPNASAASDLRMRQSEILSPPDVKKVVIQIR
ncbi:MAG TPA: hypothetical protein VLF21_00510 [Candidatus Saccharimonadales bacterium]|nr:hypothetical protein [Candidatus Saccharimonadales bacterium]